MAQLLTLEEGKTLLQLCRAGKLYEIEKWIASGKSLRLPPECKTTSLQAAIETDFYSMVELIARHESDQAIKNAALYDAVVQRRMNIVELLLANGADLKSVPFVEVLLSWDPKMIRLFLSGGADAISGAPSAEAFGAKIRTAIRPFLEYKRDHPELEEQLQEQLDSALRHFCREGNLKWVNLLLWAGANPRTRGPLVVEDYADEAEENFTTAVEEACYAENADLLKKLRPDPGRDNLTLLLRKAALLARKDTIVYLLGLGANPNDKESGGSSGLGRCLANFRFESFDPYRRQISRYSVSRTLECIQILAEHSAQWKPDGPEELRLVRRSLLECEPAVTIEVLQVFVKHNACSRETIEPSSVRHG